MSICDYIAFFRCVFFIVIPLQQDDLRMSELLPFQKNSTLPSRVLTWIQYFEPRSTPLPVVIVQECLTAYIQKQVKSLSPLTEL